MQNPPARQFQDISTVAQVFGILILVGLLTVLPPSITNKATAGLWCLASLAVGVLFGFLFGIPRVLQGTAPPGTVQTVEKANAIAEDQPVYRQQVNTNLEQISDWLTKIIVGIGLVELRNVPEALGKLGVYVGQGLGVMPDATVYATAMIVYFAVLGFLGGYLITRIYLAGAFSRADVEATANFGGTVLSVQEVSKVLSSQIADLRQFVMARVTPADQLAPLGVQPAEATAPAGTKVNSILWVDDQPSNNSVLIDQLRAMNIQVDTALSTADGLALFKRRQYDRVISDMGRPEGTKFNETAGLDLVRALRADGSTVPIVIFCSSRKATAYRSAALEAGANEITSSSSVLFQALALHS